MNDTTTNRAADPSAPDRDARRRLEVYLRDHFAGATGGTSLARRCREANERTGYESVLIDIEREIAEDRESLRSIVDRLDIAPNPIKNAIGAAAELVGRLKSNGHLVRYSPSSRVVELEALAAGVTTKRNLWRALRLAGIEALDPLELDRLIERATDQLERLLELHGRAAREAFATAGASPPRD